MVEDATGSMANVMIYPPSGPVLFHFFSGSIGRSQAAVAKTINNQNEIGKIIFQGMMSFSLSSALKAFRYC